MKSRKSREAQEEALPEVPSQMFLDEVISSLRELGIKGTDAHLTTMAINAYRIKRAEILGIKE